MVQVLPVLIVPFDLSLRLQLAYLSSVGDLGERPFHEFCKIFMFYLSLLLFFHFFIEVQLFFVSLILV